MTHDELGGYRMVRVLGEGPRAQVYLGHPVAATGASEVVALKVYRDGVEADDILREVEALERAAGPHVVELRDVATTRTGTPALILQRLSNNSLASLLVARPTLRPGEVVTILAPLAEAIRHMHDAGVTHGSLRASSIGFTSAGAPVLSSFGSAQIAPRGLPSAHREAHPEFASDLRAFARLAEDVLTRVAGSDAVLDWVGVEPPSVDWCSRFSERLFAWSAPAPVRFDAPAIPEAVPRPAGVPLQVGSTHSAQGWRDRLDRLREMDWKAAVRTQAQSIRPRFWVLGGGVLAAVLAATLAIPPGPTDATPTALSAPDSGQSTLSPAPEATPSPVESDDPVAALKLLLETRERCFRDLSILCLDAVAQPTSSALDQDQRLMRDLQDGAGAYLQFDVGTIVLTERMGGTALLAVNTVNGEPAPILIMRSEAGWRIRDYVG